MIFAQRVAMVCLALAGWVSATTYYVDPNGSNGNENLFSGRSGQEKKDAAMSFVSAALGLAESISNRQVVNEAAFKQGLAQVIDGTVQCLNSSAWAKPGMETK